MKNYSIMSTALFTTLLTYAGVIESRVTVGRIIDTQGSTLTCDLTVGTFEGTGTMLNGDFIFLTSATFSGCNSTKTILSKGAFNATNSTIYDMTITGEQSTIENSTITIMKINPTTPELERKYLTLRGATSLENFSITTYVTLVVEGNAVLINGQAIAEGTYQLIPNQVFP